MTTALRPVWAEIDLDAVRANVRAWLALVQPAAVPASGTAHLQFTFRAPERGG